MTNGLQLRDMANMKQEISKKRFVIRKCFESASVQVQRLMCSHISLLAQVQTARVGFEIHECEAYIALE